jgi:4-hydroxy-3-methylbut-2-en-1-yl diphosphate synthase IspG/GcpE
MTSIEVHLPNITATIPTNTQIRIEFIPKTRPSFASSHPLFVAVNSMADLTKVYELELTPEITTRFYENYHDQLPSSNFRLRIIPEVDDLDFLSTLTVPPSGTIHLTPTTAIGGLNFLANFPHLAPSCHITDLSIERLTDAYLAESAFWLGTALTQYPVASFGFVSENPHKGWRQSLELQRVLGMNPQGIQLISCPTCARSKNNIVHLAERIFKRTASITTPLKIAIMGCEVNGPGEARECDVGIAGGRERGLLFSKGEPLHTVPASEMENALIELIENMSGEKCLGDENETM